MGGFDGRGYPLPAGDAYTDEQQCCFVYLPVGDEYRRAFFGALDYFGTWLAWERDAGKRGQDAARAWKLANELTRECWDMGTCDLMVSELQAIRLLLSEQHCCDGNNIITYIETTVNTTTIVPGVGDYPASWGESEEPADWDDWAQYVCYHAHLYVDYLIESSETLDTLIGIGSWGIDFLGFILSRMIYGSPGGIPVPVNFGWVTKISNALLGALDSLEFDTMASKIESGRQDIVCAFMLGTSLEDAVESAVDNSLLWTVFYSWLDYESTVAAVYTGEVPGVGYLVPEQRDDCLCEEVPEGEYVPNWHWRLGAGDWLVQDDWLWQNDEYENNGFDIDGVMNWNSLEYPSYQGDLRSPEFSWPGGDVQWRVLARSSASAVVERQRTTVIIRLMKMPENEEAAIYSTVHEGNGIFTLEEDLGTSPHYDNEASDYYLKVSVNGYEGYGGKKIDYISLNLGP